MYDFTFLVGAALSVPFSVFIFFLLRYISCLRMYYEPVSTDGDASEAEDFVLSDLDELAPAGKGVLNIDSNARIVSEGSSQSLEGDACDSLLVNNADFSYRRHSENKLDTDTEELNVSDEEGLSCKPSMLQCLNIDGTVTGIPRSRRSSSAFNYSNTTVFKEGYAGDTEEMSDEDDESWLKSARFDKPLTIAGLRMGVRAATPMSPATAASRPLSDFNIMSAFSNSLLLNEGSLVDFKEESEMTCLEFLSEEYDADADEGNVTGAEDFSLGSADEAEGESTRNVYKPSLKIPDADSGRKESLVLCPGDSRKSSGGFHTEDEIFCVDNLVNFVKKKKRCSLKIVPKEGASDEYETDEEMLDENDGEWTETNESGGMKQVTQIKTETSIKLEGEGDDAAFGGNVISQRTTTTTRIITSVNADGEEESQREELEGDDLRHSVEVILNQFMSDSDVPNLEDSATKHGE